jgi:hypothetical protein
MAANYTSPPDTRHRSRPMIRLLAGAARSGSVGAIGAAAVASTLRWSMPVWFELILLGWAISMICTAVNISWQFVGESVSSARGSKN